MQNKELSELINSTVLKRLAQNSDIASQSITSSPQVIQIGEGVPLFKDNLSGPELAAVVTHPLSADDVFMNIKATLHDVGFDPSVNYSAQQQNEFTEAVRNNLVKKYGNWLNLINKNLVI